MELILPKELQGIKDKIKKRWDLVLEKNKMHLHMKKTLSNLESHIYKTQYETKEARDKDVKYIKYFLDTVSHVRTIEEKILEVDKELALAYEMTFGNFVAKVNLPERITEVGDTVNKSAFMFVPSKTDSDFHEVSVDDLFTLKQLRFVFHPENVEFISKDNYKGDGESEQ